MSPDPDQPHRDEQHHGEGSVQGSSVSGKQQQGQGHKGRGPQENTDIPAVEWVVGAVSVLVVLGLLAFVTYEAATTLDLPAMIALHEGRVVPMEQGYVAEFTAYNDGGRTARALQVEGTLYADTAEVETASATVSWVPAGTHRQGGLFFQHDPRRYRLELQPKGYDEP